MNRFCLASIVSSGLTLWGGNSLLAQDYTVVDTAQSLCYGNSVGMTCPTEGTAFYGQDAQYDGSQPSYTLSGDGLTVYDNNTGLTWQRTPDTDGDGDVDSDDKLTWAEFLNYPATLNAQNFGGYDDWRRPTIKELYSLIDFGGIDPSGYTGDPSGLVPFIDTDYFDFAYGDESAGERIIDAQYFSSTEYVGTVFGGDAAVFGVNFADGRIKGYPRDTGPGGTITQFVRCVRGNIGYGLNDLIDNGDGTVTDLATGLMWMQDDSGAGYNWEEALEYAENLDFAGHDDWRLPNAKELQSIVDYTRSPSTTGSAAIDEIFNATPILDEGGGTNYPFYWTGTTHVNWTQSPGEWAAYVAFGEALGWMQPPPPAPPGTYVLQDVHGAGAQRSDPKSGDPADWPNGHGPQGDVVRIYNYVRAVRDAGPAECTGDEDCDDGIGCTDNTCESTTCVYTPNNANCPDDGLFCNGTESCDADLDCVSSGDPCPGQVCDEDNDLCTVPVPAIATWGVAVMTLLILTLGTLACAARISKRIKGEESSPGCGGVGGSPAKKVPDPFFFFFCSSCRQRRRRPSPIGTANRQRSSGGAARPRQWPPGSRRRCRPPRSLFWSPWATPTCSTATLISRSPT